MKKLPAMKRLTVLVSTWGLALPMLLTHDAQAQFKVLYTFSGMPDAGTPDASVIMDSKKNMYGTTSIGGTFNLGAVYKLTPAGKETVLYSFKGGTDGAYPYAALTLDAKGNLYGTTSAGGGASGCFGSGCGTFFKLTMGGKETVLHAFSGGTDGGLPYSALVPDKAGNFYGGALFGGDLSCNPPAGCGAVFKLTPTGKENVLYSFTGGADGAYPLYESLALDPVKKVLYGTTQKGGNLNCNTPNGCGTIFKLTLSGKLSVMYSFTGGNDGAFPAAGVTLFNGSLYGTAPLGGANGKGTLFKIKAKIFTTVHSFGLGTDGASPLAGVAFDGAGNSYVPTEAGGSLGYGAVCKVDTKGKETVLHSFNYSLDGGVPLATPTYDPVCKCLLLTASQGGTTKTSNGYGTVDRELVHH